MSKEALKLALEALEYWDVHGKLHQPTEEAITAIKQALEQPAKNASKQFHEWAVAEHAAPVQPVAMRMPKVGDRVVCIEDESFGTVVYLTAGGSPEIKFDDGSHGTYMLREFAELFGYTTPPAAPVQVPVAYRVKWPAFGGGYKWVMTDKPTMVDAGFVNEALYTTPPAAQRKWVGLTNEERLALEYTPQKVKRSSIEISFATEAKLKEKNT
jgi:hypothetical protein